MVSLHPDPLLLLHHFLGLYSNFSYQACSLGSPRCTQTCGQRSLLPIPRRRWKSFGTGCGDIGFVGARLPGSGLRYDVVAQDEVVLAVPVGHSFADRNEVELSDLEGQPFLEREGGSGTLRSVRQILSKNGLALPAYRVVMVLSSTQAILSAVERGYGIGWVSSLALRGARAGHVAGVRLAGVPLMRNLYLVQEKQRPLPVVAAAFAQWVRQDM